MALVVFIAANLAVGSLLSPRPRTGYKAMRMAFFLFLPSKLSGFMFPFRGRPEWVVARMNSFR